MTRGTTSGDSDLRRPVEGINAFPCNHQQGKSFVFSWGTPTLAVRGSSWKKRKAVRQPHYLAMAAAYRPALTAGRNGRLATKMSQSLNNGAVTSVP